MKSKRLSECPIWPYLVALLLVAVITNILFNGLKGMMDYRKAMEPSLSINFSNLRFFTKDYVQRLYQRLTVEKLPVDSTIPEYYLYADEGDLESLESDLPASGKTQFKQGHLKVLNPGNAEYTSEVMFRYRGGLPLHWLYKKKSLRIKLPPFETFRGERQFNLVNPSTIFTITDWISYDLSKELGLLTPEYFPVRLFINNVTNGLHFFLSRIDESFLRKNKRMPGSIYSGDTIYIANPFGADTEGMNERSFVDNSSGESFMWQDYRLWEKNASRNADAVTDRRDIKKFIEVINSDDPEQFMNAFATYFDKEKFYRFWALDTLVGGFHHDLYHNHKLYFDPYKGKFEPIAWDLRFWSFNMPQPEYPLLKKVKLNPYLEYERNKAIFDLWKEYPVERIVNEIDVKAKEIFQELAADPFRQHPDSNNKQFQLDKVVPFSMNEFNEAIEDMKLTYKKRHGIVRQLLDESEVEYRLESAGINDTRLILAVSGNSPVEFNPWNLIPDSLASQVEIQRILDGEMHSVVSPDEAERLYPGRKTIESNPIGREDAWSIMTFGKNYSAPAVLVYEFKLKNIKPSLISDNTFLHARNGITGKQIELSKVPTLAQDELNTSPHPWRLQKENTKMIKQVLLSGDIDVSEDMTFESNQHVEIAPGTVFRMGKNRSVIFHGKVSAIGNADNPIIFKQKIDGESWGAIIVKGHRASESHFSHIKVTGGSLVSHELIDYPGQFNIHDVGSFTLSHCLIENNTIGDDALHVAYSQGAIDHCHFENTAFDALDMDIVNVKLSNASFRNIGNDAVDLMTSIASAENIDIENTGDKCFSIGEASQVQIKQANMKGCEIGVAVKDDSVAQIDDISFGTNISSPIALYRKNPRYSKGGTISGGNLKGITLDAIQISETSMSHIIQESLVENHAKP